MLQNIELLGLSSISLALAFATGSFICYLILPALFDPLRDIPGPFLARFTRWWLFLEIYKGTFEITNVDLHKKFGPIVRVAPGEYSIDDVEAVKTIYGLGTGFPKAPWYWAWMAPDPTQASLFSNLSAPHHRIQRRKFAASYSMSSLVGYEHFVDNCTSLLVQRLSEISGRTVDLQHWLQCYAFDVIGEITFGNRFGFLDKGEDKDGVFQALDQRGAYSTFVGIFPWIHRWLYPMVPKSGGHGYVFNYTLKQIDNRQEALKDPQSRGREGPPDIMTKVLMSHEEDPAKVTKMDLISICQSNIAAGSDTTAITLSAILFNLMTHPQSHGRLREEIDTAAKEGRISDPVKFTEAQNLPYLQAVIKEGLRIHSATGLPMQRIVPPEGTTIAGRLIPGGCSVGINAWVSHRNKDVYGSDTDEWRPERWLESEAQGRGVEMERYFFAFGMGSRTCIGKNISLLEISKLIPTLVRKFDFKLDETVEKEGLKTLNRWFVKQQNFLGRVSNRSEQ